MPRPSSSGKASIYEIKRDIQRDSKRGRKRLDNSNGISTSTVYDAPQQNQQGHDNPGERSMKA
jgi:hypothetical protein